MINEDYEREYLTDFIYLREEEHLFLQEMMNSNPDVERKPAVVLNLSKNDNPNPITLRGNNKEELQSGHDLHASADQGKD